MKERPILFSAPMVRAILEGRKTQTRRVVRHQPIRCTELPFLLFPQSKNEEIEQTGYIWPNAKEQILQLCPYGQPGDRLWVREAFRTEEGYDHIKPSKLPVAGMGETLAVPFWYDAGLSGGPYSEYPEGLRPGKYRPGMFMPRAACRILLEIVSVRVERLADISKDDAMAEGIVIQPDGGFGLADSTHYNFSDPTDSYCSLWESINGTGSWNANPWVWVVEFKREAA